MRAAGFDLSSDCGWGVWDGVAAVPLLGPKRVLFWGEDDGKLYEAWRRWVGRFLKDHGIEVVGIEGAALGNHTDEPTMQRQAGIRAFLVWACHVNQIPVYTIPPSTWRKSFIGFGTGPRQKKGEPKPPATNWKALAKKRCRHLNWDFHGDHNVAEAAGVLDNLLFVQMKITPPWRQFETTAFLPLTEI